MIIDTKTKRPTATARTRQERRETINYRQLTDEQLLASYYDQNDHIAFEELDLRYRPTLAQSAYYKLGRIAGRRQIADDLASETLVKVVETRGKHSAWDRQRAVKPWLFTILHNSIGSFVRVKHNQTLSLSDLDRPANDGEEISLADMLPAESPSIEESLLADALDAEFARALPEVASRFSGPARMVVLNVFAAHLEDGRESLEFLNDLAPAERAVVIDGLGHKLDQQTIAKMHNVSTAQVSKVLTRARADMSRRLAERGFAAASK